ncbi:MAG TPA: heavy metal-binding domain-containing protein [Streptosporangiaceae bacterium]
MRPGTASCAKLPTPATAGNQARERMWSEARARGANAIVAMRFDCNEIGGIMSEVAAYGTAVTVEPLQSADPADVVDRQ